jgi:TrmH family RNA methyltransferase
MADRIERPVPLSLARIGLVLVEPKAPGNIGAAARAMKTMGLSRLVLVNPASFQEAPEARWFAHGAEDVLEGAAVVPTVDEALQGVAYAVGTTNRTRGAWLSPVYTMEAAAREIVRVAQHQPVALLFGREDRGLINDELERCHLIARIPAATMYPSLNLAQAVMVCAYEIFQAAMDPPPALRLRLAGIHDVERICHRINDTMVRIGFVPRPEPDTFLRSLRRVFRRSFRLEDRDIATLHKLCDEVDAYIERRREQASGDRRKG